MPDWGVADFWPAIAVNPIIVPSDHVTDANYDDPRPPKVGRHDRNGDGIPDMVDIDEDRDGYAEVREFDNNQDGKIELFLYNDDDNGTFDRGEKDADGDGFYHQLWTDKNGNGRPDRGEFNEIH